MKYEEFKKTLGALETLLAAAVNDDGSPILSGDYDPKQMQEIMKDHISMIRGCYASINYLSNALYDHLNDPMHPSSYANYDHKSYANKVLGFGREELVQRAAYANTSKQKIIIG